MTVSLKDFAKQLQQANVPNPMREVRLLTCHVLGCTYESLLFNDQSLTPEQVNLIASLIQRRIAHEPLSKITGQREFWSLNFKVTAHTLDPRPDSETLITAVLQNFPNKQAPLRFIDFGTGTGCLLLSLLHEYPCGFGVGVDLSFDALQVAQENAKNLGLAERAAFVQGSWVQAFQGSVDCIISNPPYIDKHEPLDPAVQLYDPAMALFADNDGLGAYADLLSGMGEVCHPQTHIFLEIGQGQGASVSAIAAANGFQVKQTYKDLSGIERGLVLKIG
jgi:release factor glutamine methyltransferase